MVQKTFTRQVFATPKEGVEESEAIIRKRNRLSFNFENCTFHEEPYTGIFFDISQDEKSEIRLKAIDALKYFSSKYPSIQDKAQDILMNMLNDEFDDVRIASFKCMAAFDNTLILDQNSVNIVIFNLKEYNPDLRHSIYFFFGHIKVDKWDTFKLLTDHLLINMHKFKLDRYGIFKTFKRLGENHSDLVNENLEKILGHELNFKFIEPDWNNNFEHIAKMIMICSSIHKNQKILDKMPWYFEKQWKYYSDKYPELGKYLIRVLYLAIVSFKLFSQTNKFKKDESQVYNYLRRNRVTEHTFINKYRLQKYSELLILLKKIKNQTATD